MQVLVALAIGDANDTAGLSDLLAMNRSTVSHALGVLEDRALITREADSADRRRSTFQLAGSGTNLVETFASRRHRVGS